MSTFSKYNDKQQLIEKSNCVGGVCDDKSVFTYDDKGYLIREDKYKKDSLTSKTLYKNDEKGNPLERLTYDATDKLVKKITSTYDKEGNETENVGIKVKYLHSDVDTLDRIKIIRELRIGEFDVLVGINLLREGLDIPEVSLVAILDADKEGFLRSQTSLIQTIGRAARNANGKVIMYADIITNSMREAIEETKRRRNIQQKYNEENSITPTTIYKEVRDLIVATKVAENDISYGVKDVVELEELRQRIIILTQEMLECAENLEFEKAAKLRDSIKEIEERIK